jgi:hypothetical protein
MEIEISLNNSGGLIDELVGEADKDMNNNRHALPGDMSRASVSRLR